MDVRATNIDLNYWADYNGTDSDGDGIGDLPYFYNDILQDNHPLMEPVVISTSIPMPAYTPEPTPTLEPTSSPEPTSTPTSTPFQESRLTEQEAILGVAVIVAVLVAGLGLLVYLIKRK